MTMETARPADMVGRKGGLLYPILVIAGIAVTMFSAVGIATIMGWMPSALSGANQATVPVAIEQRRPPQEPGRQFARNPAAVPGHAEERIPSARCSVTDARLRSHSVRGGVGSGATAAGWGRRGAAAGDPARSQIGSGAARPRGPVARGAGATADARRAPEKISQYHVRVRMDDGRVPVVRASSPRSPPPEVRITDKGMSTRLVGGPDRRACQSDSSTVVGKGMKGIHGR